jgi:PAS domain S-box-containing protein
MSPRMGGSSIPELLGAWRAAERRWERRAPADEVRAAALDVIRAYVAYQDAALPADSPEFMLIADEHQTYVGVTRVATRILGYSVDELLGRSIADLAAPADREATPDQWLEFLRSGRQEGTFSLLARDGQPVRLHYVARAHHPVPGFHMSRLWPVAPDGELRAT